jgi:hypothetical protein
MMILDGIDGYYTMGGLAVATAAAAAVGIPFRNDDY